LSLLHKIKKKMCTSKEYFASAGDENIFTQPLLFFGAMAC